MSPIQRLRHLINISAPRVSGDEPRTVDETTTNGACSPRERG